MRKAKTTKSKAATPKSNEEKALQKAGTTDIAPMGFSIGQTDMGAGLEGLDAETLAIPFLRVLQKLSDEVEEENPNYIEGAKAGQFLNTVTQEIYSGKEGVLFIPCAFQRRFLRFAPRGEGGYKGQYTPEEVQTGLESGDIEREDGRLMIEGDFLYDTRSHYGLVQNSAGEYTSVLLTLRATQIKKSRRLLSLLTNVKVDLPNGSKVCPPTWANKIRITTVLESNDQGNWYGVHMQHEGFIDSQDLYDQGRDLYNSIQAGEVKVDYDQAVDGMAGSDDTDDVDQGKKKF